MKMALRLFLAFFLLCGVVHAQKHLGELVTKSGKAIAVEVESSQPQTRLLMTRAFNAHGAFTVVDSKGALVLRVEPSGNGAVVTVETPVSKQVRFRQEVRGDNATDAVLRACDAAVEFVTQKPGFFAGQIAFVTDKGDTSEICVGNLFFQGVRQLTNDNNTSLSPHFSPDGRKITYTGYFQNGFPDLYVIEMGSFRRRSFASYKGTNTGGVFSPDGSRVAMILSSSGNAELYVADAEGRNPRRLTTTIKAIEASPTWSPDGTRIAVSSDPQGSPQIYEIGANGGTLRRLPTGLSGYCTEPTWNPRDPNVIAFTARTGGTFQIGVYDFKTGQAKFVTNSGDVSEPCWTNDGRHLICTQRNGRKQALVLVDTESGRRTALHSPQFGNASMATFYYPKR